MKFSYYKGTTLVLVLMILAFGLSAILWIVGREVGSIQVLILSSAFLIYLSLKNRFDKNTEWKVANSVSYLYDIIFFVLIAFSITSLLMAQPYTRPISFFVVITIQCVLLALDVLTFDSKKHWKERLILVKILIVAAFLRWSLFYVFPSLIGIDPLGHVYVVKQMMTSGRFPSQTYNPYYATFPVFHLILDVTSLISGLDLRTSMILSIGFLEIIGLVLINQLGKKMFNVRVGLLASIFLCVTSSHIYWGYWIIPMTLGLSMFAFCIYILFDYTKLRSIRMLGLYLLFSFYTIFVNPVVSFLTFVSISVYVILHHVKRKILFLRTTWSDYVSIVFPIAFLVAMLSYWVYGTNFIQWAVEGILSSYVPTGVSSEIFVTVEEHVLDTLGLLFSLVFSIVGALYLLNSKSINISRLSLPILGGFFLGVWDFGGVAGIFTLVPERWLVFSQLVLAIPFAFGLALVIGCIKNRKRKTLLTSFVVAIISFFMITSHLSNMDNPLYTTNLGGRYAFLTSEMRAASFLSIKSNSSILTDVYYAAYFATSADKNASGVDFRYNSVTTLAKNEILLLRHHIIDHTFNIPTERGGIWAVVQLDYDPRTVLDNYTLLDRVYYNGAVIAYANACNK